MKHIIYMLIVLITISSCVGDKKVVGHKVVSHKENNIVNKYAEILKTSNSEIKNITLYTFIDDWYGTKYKYGGLTKSGIDCSGFANILYKEVYNKELDRRASDIAQSINKISKTSLKEGDLVFFNISGKKDSHVGIYLMNNMFVHASTSKGVIISSLENPYYKKNYSKGGRL